jgi:hypothetical protein
MAKAIMLFLLVLFVGGWLILKPGVFFVPPSPYEPEGVILIYYEKTPGMPIFSSPESLCMAQYGQLTTSCLEAGQNTFTRLSGRPITRLPYAAWVYELILP